VSQANYIVICRGRIAVGATGDPVEKIVRVSECAAQLVTHLDLIQGERFTDADSKPVSKLQHWLMDNMHKMNAKQVDVKVAEMFGLLDELEDKFKDAAVY
jgi:hypothetical protein